MLVTLNATFPTSDGRLKKGSVKIEMDHVPQAGDNLIWDTLNKTKIPSGLFRILNRTWSISSGIREAILEIAFLSELEE